MPSIFSKSLSLEEEEFYQFKRNYFIQSILRLFTKTEIHKCFQSFERSKKKTYKNTYIEIRPQFQFHLPDVIFIVVEYRSDNSIAAVCVLNTDDLRIDDDEYEFGSAFAKRLNLFGSDTVL